MSCMAVYSQYDYRRSHPYDARTKHVGFSPIRQALLASSAMKYCIERGARGAGAGLNHPLAPAGARSQVLDFIKT